MIFDFGLDNKLPLEEQAKLFIEKFNNDNENVRRAGEKWVIQYFINFIVYQNDRVRTNEISPSTVPNYYKDAKLFCIMNDIVLNWQKIAKDFLKENRMPMIDLRL